jgi:hypothetical protein
LEYQAGVPNLKKNKDKCSKKYFTAFFDGIFICGGNDGTSMNK